MTSWTSRLARVTLGYARFALVCMAVAALVLALAAICYSLWLAIPEERLRLR